MRRLKDESGRFVWVERQLIDGALTLERMTAIEAAIEAVAGAQNGVTVRSLIVWWGDVLDRWTRSA